MLLPSATIARSLPTPPAFKIEASNGYSVLVWGVPSRRGRPALVLMLVRGRADAVTYFAPATVTETSIQASLGDLGEVDVSFQPSGRATKEKSVCGDKPVVFDSGFYEGKVEFTGEEGYSQVSATRAKGDIQLILNLICPSPVGPSGTGPGVPGAGLRVKSTLPLRLSSKHTRTDPARRLSSRPESLKSATESRSKDLLMPGAVPPPSSTTRCCRRPRRYRRLPSQERRLSTATPYPQTAGRARSRSISRDAPTSASSPALRTRASPAASGRALITEAQVAPAFARTEKFQAKQGDFRPSRGERTLSGDLFPLCGKKAPGRIEKQRKSRVNSMGLSPVGS